MRNEAQPIVQSVAKQSIMSLAKNIVQPMVKEASDDLDTLKKVPHSKHTLLDASHTIPCFQENVVSMEDEEEKYETKKSQLKTNIFAKKETRPVCHSEESQKRKTNILGRKDQITVVSLMLMEWRLLLCLFLKAKLSQ